MTGVALPPLEFSMYRIRIVLALLVALITSTACGGHSPVDAIRMVSAATRVSVAEGGERNASELARSRAKRLGLGSWTYETAYGPLPVPVDYKNACLALGQAWESAAEALPGDKSIAAVRRAPSAAEAAALAHIDAAYAGVVQAARAHGVRMTPTWLDA